MLMGFYGKRNFGDDLLGLSLARFLLKHSDCDVLICASDKRPYEHLVAKSSRVRVVARSPVRILISLARCDVLCQGGGTIFHDSYTGSAFWKYQLNLLVWTLLFLISRGLRVKVIMAGAGIGPLRSSTSRALTRIALACCEAISVRDQASHATAKGLVRNTPVFIGGDLAELWEHNVSSRVCEVERASLNIGISILDLSPFYPAAISRNYWAGIAQAVSEFASTHNVHIHMFSMFEAGSKGDYAVSRRFAEELGPSVATTIYSYESNVDAMIQKIASCDVLLASRYHMAVAAFITMRPFGVICYNKKVHDFALEIQLEPNSIFAVIYPPSGDKVREFFLASLESRFADVSSGSQTARKRKTREALTELFRSVGFCIS